MSEIASWLDSQDYASGVALYRKHASDPVLLTIFSLPESSFTRKKLESALQSLVPMVDSSESKVERSEKEITPKPVLDLIRKRSQLHEALFHQTSRSDRHKIANTILAIGNKLDGWYDHGELPSGEAENELEEPEIPVNGWELHQLINTNLAYITKNKARVDKAGEVKRRERMNISIEARLKDMNHGGAVS
jgi:hypothetical protein